MKKIGLLLIIVFIGLWTAAPSYAAWLIYSKPEFKGRVIDAETKQPIEGAVVVAIYNRVALIGNPGGRSYSYEAVKETLTDKRGEFHFSSYTSIIPFWMESFAQFIFYKPGYLSSEGPDYLGSRTFIEAFFSIDVIGKVGEIKDCEFGDCKTWKGTLGILELKKANAYDERRIGVPSTPAEYTSKDLPLLFKAINDDRKERGLEVRENE
ncbi:MAG: hypothetical protein KBG22_11025 [Smithella sp.]|nr:hypothetical protein [Smithella sp.]MDM7986041.1 hypothetical protein [Smithella sp.]HOU50881.1 hypothetical protein [Smithella sp.]HQG65618.1 hypothetical protein [Smithella sp.]HQI72695.1 hypothetical protein [Smithella sp.]